MPLHYYQYKLTGVVIHMGTVDSDKSNRIYQLCYAETAKTLLTIKLDCISRVVNLFQKHTSSSFPISKQIKDHTQPLLRSQRNKLSLERFIRYNGSDRHTS